jgi:hypothetical protein
MLIVAPMPAGHLCLAGLVDLDADGSAASCAKLKARVLPSTPPMATCPEAPNASAPGIQRPLSVTMLNCGPKPRGHLRALAVTALDGDAGDALQRLGKIGIGNLPCPRR